MKLPFPNFLTLASVIFSLSEPWSVQCVADDSSTAFVDRRLNFARDIRPILSENCFLCHGPDESTREAGLRLDVQQALEWTGDSGERLIVPGDSRESMLILRIHSQQDSLRMPPLDSGKVLSERDKQLLAQWVDQGADWDQHWAFIPPKYPPVGLLASSHSESVIDTYVHQLLKANGLTMNPRAERAKLMRRLSLDLIGLPFAEDDHQQWQGLPDDLVIEKLIESLLASPQFGEKWGRHWLDVARYADSDGFEKDKPRSVWHYRDWVVAAINEDKPFDRFIIEQIAGDLLPDATTSSLIATGFLRNSMINEEGGVDPEQFRMEAMFDRMDAIGKSILGLSINCSQCHDHKYDPLSQREYYQMFAMINNCYEGSVTVYTPDEEEKRQQVLFRIKQLEDELKSSQDTWQAELLAWVESVRFVKQPRQVFDLSWNFDSLGGQKMLPQSDGGFLAQSYAPTKSSPWGEVQVEVDTLAGVQLELMTDFNLPREGPGRSIYGTAALSEIRVSISPDGLSDERHAIAITDGIACFNAAESVLPKIYDDRSTKERKTGPISFAFDGDDATAWTTDIGPGRSNQPLIAQFLFEKPVENAEGRVLRIQLVQNHGGWNSDDNQTYNLGRFRLSAIEDPVAGRDSLPPRIRQIIDRSPEANFSEGDLDELFTYWRTLKPEWSDANSIIERCWQEHPWGTSQLVLRERSSKRITNFLERGDFLKPGEEVTCGTPRFLHPIQASDPFPNRLDFAKWLVDKQSPTTARAMVNRVWQQLFGAGLVATSEDLGSQSEIPTHPELLDWLACDFMDHDWSLKHLLRTIVSSQTYQQDSVVRPEHLDKDPRNRWLSRHPRLRLEGEVLRDTIMKISGVLDLRQRGEPVCPPAPDFLFQPPVSYGPKTWLEAKGADRYRRSLYVFRFRSVPYPPLQVFDAPNGDSSCVRRTQSNTPLQALTSLNEDIFVECAQGFARRAFLMNGSENRDRIIWMVREATGRDPSSEEVSLIQSVLQSARSSVLDESTGRAICGWETESLRSIPTGTEDPRELASWTIVARILLNMDEVLCKE